MNSTIGNQRIHIGKFLEVFQQINEEGMTELECHNFATPNELLDVGTEHHLMPKHHKKSDNWMSCASWWKHTITSEVFLPKISNLSLIKPLELVTVNNLQKHRGQSTCETVPWGCGQQNPDCRKCYSTNCKKMKRDGGGDWRLKKHKRCSNQLLC